MNPHDCNSHKHLKLARLPIPPFLRSSPFARIYKLYSFYIPVSRTFFKNHQDIQVSPETKSPGAIDWSRVICSACGRRDLNPHDIAITRSLVLLVCQFRHFRSSLYEVIALSLSRRLDYNIKKVVECQPLFSIFLIFLLLFTAGFCGGSRRTHLCGRLNTHRSLPVKQEPPQQPQTFSIEDAANARKRGWSAV